MVVYLLTFFLAFVVTYLTTPVVKIIASKIKAIDIPNERKVHDHPIPRLGGLALYFGFMVAVASALIASYYLKIDLNVNLIIGILLGGTVLVIVGIVDDVKGLRPTIKLIGQIFAALIVIYFGIEINFISNPFNGMLVMGVFAIPLTIFWLVGVTNAMNMIDGLDGLATGVTAISAMTLFFVAIRTHQLGAAVLLIALAAASLAFLRYNFAPASIFLGDSGSMFLGFILASTSVIGVLKTTLVVALIIPILILGVPIFDTLFAIGRRLKEKRHPFEADNKHIHHMLLRAGFNKREAVLAIYIACFVLSFMALIMALQK
jgi:UDP-GlcNAc:undecaprenyl-phosphate/decaprenyl-phosphate GlcNAc-1-phosphate transferase